MQAYSLIRHLDNIAEHCRSTNRQSPSPAMDGWKGVNAHEGRSRQIASRGDVLRQRLGNAPIRPTQLPPTCRKSRDVEVLLPGL